MATSDPSQQAFETAKSAFKKRLKDDELFEDFLQSTSIENVWETIEKLQARQDAERRIRRFHLMEKFLGKLSSYIKVVDIYIQIRPDIMALIWGPIRFLLLCTENVAKLADAVVKAMEQIGDALPNFVDVMKMFEKNDKLIHKLALFYEDILEFYAVALEFFNASSENLLFCPFSSNPDLLTIHKNQKFSSKRCGPDRKLKSMC